MEQGIRGIGVLRSTLLVLAKEDSRLKWMEFKCPVVACTVVVVQTKCDCDTGKRGEMCPMSSMHMDYGPSGQSSA